MKDCHNQIFNNKYLIQTKVSPITDKTGLNQLLITFKKLQNIMFIS